MKIPTWVFWVVLVFVGWKFVLPLLKDVQTASGAPESNPNSSNPPAGTPAPNLFDMLLTEAKNIADSFTKVIAQTSPKSN